MDIDPDNIDFEVDPPEFSVHIPEANQLPPPQVTHQPLPLEFSADEFTFVPPTYPTSENEAIQMLLDVANEETTENDGSDVNETNARPKRQPSRPHLYQSEEEEKKEKDLRRHGL